jgi:hypothetical protein
MQSLSARMPPVIKALEMHVHVATVGSRKTGSKPAVQRCRFVIPHVVKAAPFNGQRKAAKCSEWLTTKLQLFHRAVGGSIRNFTAYLKTSPYTRSRQR